MNRDQDMFGWPVEHREDYRVDVYVQPTPTPTWCSAKVTHIPTGITETVKGIHQIQCRREAFAAILETLATIASIREVADEYPAEVGDSALLAEWMDREVR